MKGIIYKYTNLINGKVYIGQTFRPKERINEHKSCSKNRDKTSAFHNAIRKYGINNFKYEIIETTNSLDSNFLNEREIYWIKEYHSSESKFGYNISLGGSTRGMAGNPIDMYDKNGNLIEHFNNSKEIIKMFNCKRSIIYHCLNTEDALFKRKYILKWQGQPFSYTGGKKSKHIYYQCDKHNNIIKVWSSVCDIEKELGYCSSTIVKCCIHPDKYKSYKGYKWYRAKKL